LRTRILVATLSVTLVTLLVFGVPLAWALGRFYRGEQLSRLQQAATMAAAAVPAEGLHGADPLEPPTVPAGIHLAYYDDRGALVAGSGPAQADHLAAWGLAGRPMQGASGSFLASVQPITANETTIGTVEASSSLSVLAWRSHRAWLEMFALGVVALAAATLIALWQARRLARPVDELIAAADRLGDGDFAVSVPPSGIGEIDRAAQALVSTSEQLGDLVERERAFTANASHQLRTPLTALRLTLESALLTPGADVEQAVRDGVAETDRIQATLDQLFALARTRSGPAGELFTRSMPVGDVLGDLERRWHPTFAERGRRFEVHQEGQVDRRDAPVILGQILDILVDNAATHGRGTVDVAATALSGGLRIRVHDEGDDAAEFPEVVSDAGPGDSHGRGLGLADSLARAAGGRLVLRAAGPSGGGPGVAVILPWAGGTTGPAVVASPYS
jgi:signal transduction histidine kinase